MNRIAWACLSVGTTGLLVVAFAYWFTHEPAPGIRVTWRANVTPDEQRALERRYMLSNRRAPHPEQPRSLAYDLLDTTEANIRALGSDPAVEDTNDIDDQWARVRLGTAYGDEWMWIAHRLPLVRHAEVRWTIIVILAAMTAWGLYGLGRRPPRRTEALFPEPHTEQGG